MRDPISDDSDGTQLGYVEGTEVFDMEGKKLYDLNGANLIDPKTMKVVGHLQHLGASGPGQSSASNLFPKKKRR